jgi:hypothetical protein
MREGAAQRTGSGWGRADDDVGGAEDGRKRAAGDGRRKAAYVGG